MTQKISIDNFYEVTTNFSQLQNVLAQKFDSIGTGQKKFDDDNWCKDKHNFGNVKTITKDKIFEKGGINFSCVRGRLPSASTNKRTNLFEKPFMATGISVVMHPYNPFVPISHANFRLFTVFKDDSYQEIIAWWFGGGFDLTPCYVFKDDCILWHVNAKKACDTLESSAYQDYKKWCDDYFYLPHRQETRGIGGIFFDDLNTFDFHKCKNFVHNGFNAYLESYANIVNNRYEHNFSQKHKDFQLYRRGRYVEFNLLYDRGTLFGLQFSGRTEAILMSLPPQVSWKYNWQPDKNSEEQLLRQYLKPRKWI